MHGELIRDKGIDIALWRRIMTDQAINSAGDHLDIQDAARRIKAIFIGSIGNLVEWYEYRVRAVFRAGILPKQRSGRAAAQRRGVVRRHLS